MSRLITLWLLYIVGHDVGRYIGLEKRIDASKETYYEALGESTLGWREGEHDLRPWTDYFLGIFIAAYREFESRTGALGSKKALITTFIDSLMVAEFTIADVRQRRRESATATSTSCSASSSRPARSNRSARAAGLVGAG